MFNSPHNLPRLLTTFAAVVALAVPASAGAYTDLRNPDSKDVAAATQAHDGDPSDLRNPDSRDVSSTQRVAAPAPQAPTVADEPGFDWGDAGIGAGAVLGLTLITLSVMFGVVHRRNRSATA